MTTEILTQVRHEKLVDVTKRKVQTARKYKWDIVWINVIAMSLIHLAALYGFIIRKTGKTESIVFWKVLSGVAAVGVTGGAHRLWSHRSYKANTIAQLIFAFMFTTTYQNSIYIWARDHRLHHKYSETDADPHNAKRGFFFSHMGWLLVRKQKEVIEKGKTIDMSDLRSNPIVMFQHKYYFILMPVIGFLIPTLIPWYFWNESLTFSFFTVTMYRYIVVSHITWCINSLAHLIGNKPYDKNIGATDNLLMAQIGYGEGGHNYHHTYPWDYRNSEFGDEWRNITSMTIDLFAFFGWVTDRKTATPQMVQKRVDKTGDGSRRFRNVYDFLTKLEKTVFTNTINFVIWYFYMYCL